MSGIIGRGVILAIATIIATDMIYNLIVMAIAFIRMAVATARFTIKNKDKSEEELEGLLNEFIEEEGNKIVLHTREEFDFLH